MRVHVQHESARLRAVLVIRPDNLPRLVHSMGAPPPTWRALPEPERLLAQLDGLVALLRALGIEVRVHTVPATSSMLDAMFARDVAKVIDDRLVLCTPSAPGRDTEPLLLANQWNGAGWPDSPTPQAPSALEGADLLLGPGCMYARVGHRTSLAGALWAAGNRELRLCHASGPAVPQHLLGGHRIMGDTLWQRSDVEPMPWLGPVHNVEPDDEVVERLAMNWVALDHHTVIMPAGCPGMRARLAGAGIESYTLAMDEIAKLAGGFACSTLPLVRHDG